MKSTNYSDFTQADLRLAEQRVTELQAKADASYNEWQRVRNSHNWLGAGRKKHADKTQKPIYEADKKRLYDAKAFVAEILAAIDKETEMLRNQAVHGWNDELFNDIQQEDQETVTPAMKTIGFAVVAIVVVLLFV